MRLTVRNTNDPSRNASFQSWANTVWAANKTGPHSIATGNAAAWLSYPVISSRSDEVSSNLAAQNHASYLPANTDPTVAAGYRAQMLSYADALKKNNTAFYNLVITGGASSGAALVALHPLSRGTVNIDLRDPSGREPLVDYRALSNPIDTVIMTDILRFTRRYHLNNPAMAALNPAEASPGSRISTDAQFADYLSQTLSPTEYHPAGTAAMMPRELGGVVDEELKVYGVQGLRVVDASMIPTLPGANTCQTVYAVAEKVSFPFLSPFMLFFSPFCLDILLSFPLVYLFVSIPGVRNGGSKLTGISRPRI